MSPFSGTCAAKHIVLTTWIVSTTFVPALAAADVYARGDTLARHWDQLHQQYSQFHYRSGYFVAQPPSKSAAIFERLRAMPPTAIGGLEVEAVRDLGTGQDSAQPGEWGP